MIARADSQVDLDRVVPGVPSHRGEKAKGMTCFVTAIARELSKIHGEEEDRFVCQARRLLEQAFHSVEAY